MDQKPSIGRIVHFASPAGYRGEVWAAIVTRVHSDSEVDLTAFTPGSGVIGFSRMALGGPDVQGTWFWPPRT